MKSVTQTSRKDHKGAGIALFQIVLGLMCPGGLPGRGESQNDFEQLPIEHYLCFQTVKFLLLSLLFVWFYLSMSTVICIFAAFSEYGLYRDYSTGYNP